ncbi:MAG: hypothetical protein ACOCPW_05080 [Marinilabiliaceae bacterium]
MTNYHPHTFHVPVLGIGYTIDSPLKLAHLGITSVVSLVDDMLMEKMREFHSRRAGLPFKGISYFMEDFRAKRITAYLNLLDERVRRKVDELKNSLNENIDEACKFFELLPDYSTLKKKYDNLRQNGQEKELKTWMDENLRPGNIDVNIMTKLDRVNYQNNEPLSVEYNDAHAALRGFASSNLTSSVVLSAGMNPSLFSYLEKWDDFFPDLKGNFRKKVILKVSDFRSALVQGKMLAKKGIWVSEYRVESGLNCGGHAFASQGNLMGPVLEEFKANRQFLIRTQFDIMKPALAERGRVAPETPPELKISAQGGVGTAEEHEFLRNYYNIDSVGWGTPFLLVPEAVNIDYPTLELLSNAREKDLFLSNVSPLGVPFNNLRGNTKDEERDLNIRSGRPGSKCLKQYCSLNSEFQDKPVCTASRGYQRNKLNELEWTGLTSPSDVRKQTNHITEKSCICVGLGTSALIANKIDASGEGPGVSVCPGPNMAYFSGETSLKSMIDHIYGKSNVMVRQDRPNMFVRELELYVDHLKEKIEENPGDVRETKRLEKFGKALIEGVEYYRNLYSNNLQAPVGASSGLFDHLKDLKEQVEGLNERLQAEVPLT